MTVYLVDSGEYDGYAWDAVYATLEAAMAAHPVPEVMAWDVVRAGGWQPDPLNEGQWWNGLQGSCRTRIHAVTVQE